MTILLTPIELDSLLTFIGYGRLEAPIWFLGMEEAGGGENNLRLRLKFRQVEDCCLAHQILGLTQFHTGKRVLQRTWRGMCYLMLRLAGQPVTRDDLRTYQAEQLGRYHGDTLLLELLPLPKPNTGAWGYEQLLPQFPSQEEYVSYVKPRRITQISELIRAYQPSIIVAYGHHF